MTNDALAPADPRRTSWPLLITGAATGLVATTVLSFVVAIAAFILAGGPLADEWACSRGEFPASAKPNGAQCFRYGEKMPPGWTADPDGNQRLDHSS